MIQCALRSDQRLGTQGIRSFVSCLGFRLFPTDLVETFRKSSRLETMVVAWFSQVFVPRRWALTKPVLGISIAKTIVTLLKCLSCQTFNEDVLRACVFQE